MKKKTLIECQTNFPIERYVNLIDEKAQWMPWEENAPKHPISWCFDQSAESFWGDLHPF